MSKGKLLVGIYEDEGGNESVTSNVPDAEALHLLVRATASFVELRAIDFDKLRPWPAIPVSRVRAKSSQS
jgi:hypothetical protein